MKQITVTAEEYRALAIVRGKNKYRNKRVSVGDEEFDSKGELAHWEQLRMMELAGEISDLQRQVRIPLLGQHDRPLMYDSNRQAALVVDFTFIRRGETHVSLLDHKGFETPASKLKRAIVAAMFGRPVEISK